jgi:hypothetical protein
MVYAHHHGGQAVDEKPNLHLQAAELHPLVYGGVVMRSVVHDRFQRVSRQRESDQHAQDRDGMRATAAHLLAEQAGHDGAEQRRKRHRQQQSLRKLYGHGGYGLREVASGRVGVASSAFEAVELVHVDRSAVAKQDHQNR